MILKKNYGVSITELMIMLVVISVIMTMSFIAYNNAVNIQKSAEAVKQLGFAVSKTRSYAQTKGIITQIIITSDKNTYTIKANGNTISDPTYFDGFSGELPSGTKVISNSCSNNIYFYIDGTPLTSISPKTIMNSDCLVKVGINNENYKALNINGSTGEVTYE